MPYFSDVCSPSDYFPNCAVNPTQGYNPNERYYSFIQRLGDLSVFQAPSTVIGYPGCAACVFNKNELILRRQMAIWTVQGMGLQPESVLSMNSPGVSGGPNAYSVLPTITVQFTFTLNNQTATAGQPPPPPPVIEYGNFFLANTNTNSFDNAPFYCKGAYAEADLKLIDGTTIIEALAYNQPLADSGCTVSLVSVGPATGSTPGKVAVLNFTFTPAVPSGQYNVFHEVAYSVGADPWENVGTLTIQKPTVAVQITDNTNPGTTDYQVGDNFAFTVTGPPNQPVTVSQNGAAPVPAINTQGSSSTGAQVIWSTAGTWALADVGNYSQTYYVAGVAGIPGLSFQISNGSRTASCGIARTADVNQGFQVPLGVNVSLAPGLSARVVFAISGTNVNPYTGSAPATSSGNSNWTAQMHSSNLPGEYLVTPQIQLLNADGSGGQVIPCNGSLVFFNVRKSPPANPSWQSCASMTGTWTAPGTGAPNENWIITDTGGTLSGSTSYLGSCGQTITFPVVRGTYDRTTQSYTMNAYSPTPSAYPCNGRLAVAGNLSINGKLNTHGCGTGVGILSNYYTDPPSQSSETLKTERLPTAETTSFAGWADKAGSPYTAVFSATLNVDPNGASYNFGGRSVTQAVPASPSGSDTCWWQGGASMKYYSPITQLIGAVDPWYVQDDGLDGSYGADYIGLGDTFIFQLQRRAPALALPSGSCTIQFPQQLSINKESGTGNDPPYTTNMIVYTITQSSVTVSRGGVKDPAGPRSIHF